MNTEWTIKKLFEEVCRIEKEYKLFERKINGVYFWKLIRFSLFMELTKKLRLHEDPHPQPKQKENRYMRILKRLINGTFYSPVIGCKGKDIEVILFPHERKVNVDSKLIDVYSYNLEKKWRQNGTSYLVVERPYNGKFIRKASRVVRYDEPLNFFSLWNYIKQKKTLNKDSIINEIDTIVNIPIDNIKTLSGEYISSVVNNFKHEYAYYRKLFSKYSPKKIYIVNAYGKNSLIAAANDLGIDTIEIQHGTISSFHVGYSYPKEVTIPYFPKRLSLWGKFWYDISQFPIDEKYVSYDGFTFLKKEIEKYSNIEKDETRVLFISQGTIGKSLVDTALKFANQNKEFKIIYRLHPSETEQWKSLYPELCSFSMKNSNISIETVDTPLYKSFAQSTFVVGVYSTALIEALAIDCKLILMDLPGVEYFQDLMDKGRVKKVKNADQLLNVIKGKHEVANNCNYFFENVKEID